jgi:hypothetical protein
MRGGTFGFEALDPIGVSQQQFNCEFGVNGLGLCSMTSQRLRKGRGLGIFGSVHRANGYRVASAAVGVVAYLSVPSMDWNESGSKH